MTVSLSVSRKNLRGYLAVSAMIALAACSSSSVIHRPDMIQPISNRAQFDDAVALLVDGDVKAARKMLSMMAKRDPSDQQTAALIASLDADPVAALGTKSFAYRVQPGDHMTSLAQRFLGDRLKFYLLARYNSIDVPKKIVTGQTLRIPGTAPPVVAAPPPRPIVNVPVHPPVAPPVEAKPVPKPPVTAPLATPLTLHRAAQLRGAGLAALNAGKVDRAVTLLRQAAALDHDSPAIRTDLARALRIQATVAARR
ncbi:LysM domain-containing protein [Sphingomonas paeninsulae]|jgi:hypothetical protein|uniref:LysM domain-containing protein n=1 Tax=Sphingomonas paeninsulae TaxID=2319844 RepID=A0A494T9A3_SPHPE|nr:LysM domain-containing protein [Sphingomonas paeninsulae]AYJ85939.1 LysM domain-containing protein [Sphingomonas paeninsulae]